MTTRTSALILQSLRAAASEQRRTFATAGRACLPPHGFAFHPRSNSNDGPHELARAYVTKQVHWHCTASSTGAQQRAPISTARQDSHRCASMALAARCVRRAAHSAARWPAPEPDFPPQQSEGSHRVNLQLGFEQPMQCVITAQAVQRLAQHGYFVIDNAFERGIAGVPSVACLDTSYMGCAFCWCVHIATMRWALQAEIWWPWHPGKQHTQDICTAECFRQEILSLHKAGGTHKNSTHLVGPVKQRQLLEKTAIHEAEVTLDLNTAAACPALAQWDADSTMRTLLSILWPAQAMMLASQATKLQYNEGMASNRIISCASFVTLRMHDPMSYSPSFDLADHGIHRHEFVMQVPVAASPCTLTHIGTRTCVE
jgi:hypothetical protein